MGILHSTTRFLGCKPEDEEEEEETPYQFLLYQRQNHCNPSGDSSVRFSIFLNAIKGLLQSLRYVFCFQRPRGKTADHPVLPIQNPESSLSSEPLLFQTTLISPPTSDDSSAKSISESAPTTFISSITDEEELQRESVEVLSSQRWRPEENDSANGEQRDNVMVSIPDFTCSLAHANESEEIMFSAVFVEEDAQRIVPVVEGSMGMDYTDKEEEEEREKAKVKIKSIVVVREERRIKHYSSSHRILLVGEGDFSFSACLAAAFGCASNITATSLDPEEFLKKNYLRALSNIGNIRSREGKVMHKIDATKMANHPKLRHRKFDRIIFNFPYAGLDILKNLPRESQLRRHRRLVSLFLKNARELISENGEIHISHKTNSFHVDFKLESIASSHRLRLIEAVIFNLLDYPGYNTKCGFGKNKNFDCNPSKTYKFGLKKVQY